MLTKKKIAVSLDNEVLDSIEKFVKSEKINRSASINLLIKLGMESLRRNEDITARFDKLEAHLKAMQKVNYRNTSFLVLSAEQNKEKFEKASLAAERNVIEIFGE